MNEASIYGDFSSGRGNEMWLNVALCDPKKKSTCKTRVETAAFLKRSFFYFYSQKNTVVEDQFSGTLVDNSKYKGDQDNYFPIQWSYT